MRQGPTDRFRVGVPTERTKPVELRAQARQVWRIVAPSENLRVGRALDAFGHRRQLFEQLLARANTREPNLDVLVGLEAAQAYQIARQVDDLVMADRDPEITRSYLLNMAPTRCRTPV